MEELQQIVALAVVIAVMIYGLLLVAGAPFGQSPEVANRYARWLGKSCLSLATLPIRIMFGKKKKRTKGRRR